MSLFKTKVLETHKGEVVKSWLLTEDNDDIYPVKEVILITVGEQGYHTTDLKMSKQQIIESNERCGFSEDMRRDAETDAMRKRDPIGRMGISTADRW